jgi:hypothetical protein
VVRGIAQSVVEGKSGVGVRIRIGDEIRRWCRYLRRPESRRARTGRCRTPYQASVGAVAACWLAGAVARQ